MSNPVPANVKPFVDALGVDGAITFLTTFGGATFYLAADPKSGSEIMRYLGAERGRRLIAALRDTTEHPFLRIPVPKKWLAATMRGRGTPVSTIARTLHVADYTVRRWLPRDTSQMDMFAENG